ncbi:MAG: flagellar biosynthetic protein FliO [Phycisphaeraceae bacterium]|nr:flagellar biosynthetic protein FliO [Phycisphaeraceae bacterium]
MPSRPSKDRGETNIGHGGPGLGRQIKTILVQFRCVVVLSAMCGMLLIELPSAAQDASAVDVERIEEMRDLSEAAAAPASDNPLPTAEAAAVQAGQASETPLPPNESLPLGAGEGDLFNTDSNQAGAGSLGDGWLLSTLAALGVVLALVFGIRWLLKRGGVVSTAAPQGGVVEVLSRTTVAPRSHVVLMRVGMRILVVSDSTSGMRTLASVHDAEEVAELLGAIESARPTSMGQSFGSVMKKLSGQWSGEDQAAIEPIDSAAVTAGEPASAVDQAEGALSRVRGRLASLSDSGGRS